MNSGDYTKKVYDYLASSGRTLSEALLEEGAARVKESFRRQLMEEREDKPGCLRMSQGGKCIRQQWYRYKGVQGEPLQPRVLVTFLTGDLLEVGMSILGRLAGMQISGKARADDQAGDLLTMEIGKGTGRGDPPESYMVHGHLDDLLYDPDTKEYLVVEYKTMSEYSFRAFEKDGLTDDWGYKTQLSLYCKVLGCKRGILVGLCKNTGHMADHIVEMDESLVSAAKERWYRILDKDEMPDREYEPVPETKYNRSTKAYDPTGRSTIPISCQYCPFKKECWPTLTMELRGEKPNWIVT